MNRPSWSYKLAQVLVMASLCSAAASWNMQAQQASSDHIAAKGWSGPLESSDIGNPAIPGSAISIKNQLQVEGAGNDIWGTADQFHFVHQKQTGDFDVAVRVTSLTAPHLYSRAGIMARESLSPGSRHVFFLVFPDNRPRHANTSAYEFQYRAQTDGDSKGIYPPQDGPPAFPVEFPNAWLRLKRTGNEFTAFVSEDGKSWTKYSAYTLDLPPTVFLGLAITSHTVAASTTATFTNLELPKGSPQRHP